MAMPRTPLAWIGLAGVARDDNARAQHWERRLHWVMVVVALLAIPAYVLGEAVDAPAWHSFARVLDLAIFLAFLLETWWMARISSHPRRYLVRNWMNFAILLGSAASFMGAATAWVAVVRTLRVAVSGLVLLKVGVDFTALFTRRNAPLLTGAGIAVALVGGAAFYWVEPNVPTYWDGVWLTFVTATTLGYGDLVPSAGPGRAVAVAVSIAGWALLSLFTANVVATFLDEDEVAERERIAHEIAALRAEIARLAAEVRGEPGRAGTHGPHPVPPGSDLEEEVRALRSDVDAIARRVARVAAALKAGAADRRGD